MIPPTDKEALVEVPGHTEIDPEAVHCCKCLLPLASHPGPKIGLFFEEEMEMYFFHFPCAPVDVQERYTLDKKREAARWN